MTEILPEKTAQIQNPSLPPNAPVMAKDSYYLSRLAQQLKQIKEWQTSKQSQYFNPYTTAVIQKAGQITQNNNNELNTLLSSSNVAKGLAGKVGVN